jgi:hypothetical protein
MKLKLIAIALGLVLGWFVVELLSLGFFAVTEGGLFYSAEKGAPSLTGPDLVPGESAEIRLHPYFGFTKIGDPERDVNNHGFAAAPYDYPFARQHDNQFIVGVFGGSVAAGFTKYGQERLIERLKEHPLLRDKEIVLLSFAQGGYKQPQQLLALSYYLAIGQELDMVVNLDGFNEVSLSSRNDAFDMDISMPSSDHMMALVNLIDQSTLSDERIVALARITAGKAQLERVSRRVANARLASTWFLWQQIFRIRSASVAREWIAFQNLPAADREQSVMAVYPPDEELSGDSLYRRIAQEWADASIMMHTLLAGRGIPYYHFLQPNQYDSDKPFTSEELSTALTENHPYRAGVEQGYPWLLDQTERLRQSGVNFHSALAIFDDVASTLYIDDCCHFNVTGNEILADFMADVILSGLAE